MADTMVQLRRDLAGTCTPPIFASTFPRLSARERPATDGLRSLYPVDARSRGGMDLNLPGGLPGAALPGPLLSPGVPLAEMSKDELDELYGDMGWLLQHVGRLVAPVPRKRRLVLAFQQLPGRLGHPQASGASISRGPHPGGTTCATTTVVDLGRLGERGGEPVAHEQVPPGLWIPPSATTLPGPSGACSAAAAPLCTKGAVLDLRDGHLPQVVWTEPRRDGHWWGPITTHRVQVVVLMIVGVAALFALQDRVWADTSTPATWYGHAWSWASLVWLSAVIPSMIGLLGMLWYRHPHDLDEVAPINNLVVWRIVSRGTNIEALQSTIRRCHSEMARTPLFPYLVEVVTDHPNTLEVDEGTLHLTVSPDYSTPNGSLFKARALHYALECSTVPEDAWLVHLDEETQPTSSGIKGIARMIADEEATGEFRIGQGAILYHRQWRKHPFLTLADMVRTGDDFARFHFQHRVGITLFGLHGSFIVCRNDIEKEVGFDFGPQGSITEDAFWALKAMEAGRRARWCDGYLEEQSTQSLMDFLKQRRRWWQGLAKVSLHAPVKLRYRAFLGFNTLTWMLAPVALLYTYLHFIWGFDVRDWIRWCANLAFAGFMVLYLTGLRANLAEHGITNPLQRAGWYAAQIVLMPVFAAMEAVGVAYAILRPAGGFHVVKK